MRERDPRINPRRGDVLKREQEMRVVTTEQNTLTVWYGEFVFGKHSTFNTNDACVIKDWRKWAAQANVIHRAEEL